MRASWQSFSGHGSTDDSRHAFVTIMRYRDNVVRIRISVDKELHERAKEVAQHKGISLAELCRRSLEEALAKEPTDKP